MAQQGVLRIGIMGFGQVGRQIYRLAAQSDDVVVAAVADIGRSEVLHYLLVSDHQRAAPVRLDGNYLVNDRFRTRMLSSDKPGEPPWDVFDVDVVIDATRAFHSRATLSPHLAAGAPRVITSSLPEEALDRLLIPGINLHSASPDDRLISAGSSTTTALALCLTIIDQALGLETASMTSVHAYTSDQPALDQARQDFRRSRSAANIIPNDNASPRWVAATLPRFQGRLSGYALNVPVQRGSLLDLSAVMRSPDVTVDDVNQAFLEAAEQYPGLVTIAHDPIVSSDVLGSRHSVIFDLQGTLKAGRRMIKTLAWYEELSHARRLLEVARLYQDLPQAEASA